jgi:hypothetical protein
MDDGTMDEGIMDGMKGFLLQKGINIKRDVNTKK